MIKKPSANSNGKPESRQCSLKLIISVLGRNNVGRKCLEAGRIRQNIQAAAKANIPITARAMRQEKKSLNTPVVGLLSIVYLTGSYSSPKAGALTARYGRGPILMAAIGMMLIGVIITGFSPVITIFIGMMVFTAGFFAAHSVASSWIGRRARRAKAQASSLYLFCYYAGSSVAGTLGGIFWLNLGWAGVVTFITTLLLLALYVGEQLRKLPEAAKI